MNWSEMFFQNWEGIVRTIIVGTLAYATLVLFLRMSGKRRRFLGIARSSLGMEHPEGWACGSCGRHFHDEQAVCPACGAEA